MAELKTKRTAASVSAFLNAIKDEQVRKDCKTIAGLMQKVTKEKPAMWGTSIIGFGAIHLKYASGRELDWFVTGFAPRKGNITLYVLGGYPQRDELLAKLGPHKASGSCLHVKRLSDVHLPTLTKLIQAGVNHMKKQDTKE
jgi:Domain of unknown function (DU1801)